MDRSWVPHRRPLKRLSERNRIATLLDNYIISIDVAQADYFAANNKYFQGLDLVSGQPDGVTNVTVDTTKMPSDQKVSWLDFDPQVFAASIALPVNIKMDVYDSPLGGGIRSLLSSGMTV